MGLAPIFLFQYQFSCTMLIFRYISSQKISDLRDWLKTHRVTALPNWLKIYWLLLYFFFHMMIILYSYMKLKQTITHGSVHLKWAYSSLCELLCNQYIYIQYAFPCVYSYMSLRVLLSDICEYLLGNSYYNYS